MRITAREAARHNERHPFCLPPDPPEPVYKRRVYRKPTHAGGACQDCGRPWKPVTVVRWWVSGGTYRVCGECIRPYRGIILAPERKGL